MKRALSVVLEVTSNIDLVENHLTVSAEIAFFRMLLRQHSHINVSLDEIVRLGVLHRAVCLLSAADGTVVQRARDFIQKFYADM